MKIVQISTLKSGGAGICALRLHQSLMQRNDVESHLLQKMYEDIDLAQHIDYVPERSSILYRLRRKLRQTPEYTNRILLPKYSSSYEYEVATFPTSSFYIEDHPLVKNADIINIHWAADFLNYPTFFSKVKQPIVWTLHDMNAFKGVFHYQGDIDKNTQYAELEKKIEKDKIKYIQKVGNLHIVTTSQWLGNHSQNSKVLGNYNHSIIASGIDFANYPFLYRNEQKEKIGIDKEKPALLFVAHGLDIYRKGFDILLKSLESIDTDINLISVGGDKISINNSHLNHIHFTNIKEVSKLNEIYSAADITILPSREDNLPNVMIESFANGTPVLSFPNGGMAEHIRTGENGILVENIDVKLLSNAIDDFLNGKYTFDRKKIKQYAKENFDIKIQTQKYIDLYKNILSK